MSGLSYTVPAFAWLACTLVFVGFWWHQARSLNANLVDVAWTAAIGVVALAFAALGDGSPVMRLLVAGLPGLWSLRLTVHIWRRSGHTDEDSRYAYLRRHWHQRTQLKFFAFYQLQALTVMVFSFQFFVLANRADDPAIWQIVLALTIGLTAVVGETLSDHQLTRWRQNPANAGRTCRSGLWRYSRHPNYFFEWLHWWAYAPLALGTSWWWLPVATQALMLATLLFGTGIPHAERQALLRRGEDYRDYQRTTSAFLPLPPRQVKR